MFQANKLVRSFNESELPRLLFLSRFQKIPFLWKRYNEQGFTGCAVLLQRLKALPVFESFRAWIATPSEERASYWFCDRAWWHPSLRLIRTPKTRIWRHVWKCCPTTCLHFFAASSNATILFLAQRGGCSGRKVAFPQISAKNVSTNF